jgi:endogenous inhibitor of DNA gyrase (YacG/DUF329 family)
MNAKIKVVCNECGKKFQISAASVARTSPQCSKCGSVDIDLRDDGGQL